MDMASKKVKFTQVIFGGIQETKTLQGGGITQRAAFFCALPDFFYDVSL